MKNLIDLSRLLVTGANGMIGRSLSFGMKYSRDRLDVTNITQVAQVCDQLQPSGILCLSSYDLRRCEADPVKARATNVLGVSHLTQQAKKMGIPLVLISTGAIFFGPFEAAFDEDSIPAPCHLYGQTKWEAETIVSTELSNYLILRTGWLFGGTPAGHVPFVETAILKAKNGDTIKASVDQRGSPTYLQDFLYVMMELISSGSSGLFHVVNSEPAIGRDIAHEIVSHLKSSSKVEEFKASDIPNAGPRRSKSEYLVSKKCQLRPWRSALRDYLNAQK